MPVPPRLRSLARHPLFVMWAFVAFSLLVKENYPFSHFPMYSHVAPETHYFYLTDGEGNNLGTKTNFGMAASNLKKKYHSYLTALAEQREKEAGHRIKASELPASDQETCGQKLFDYILERGEHRGKWTRNKPDIIRLRRADIQRKGSELIETNRLIAERKLTGSPQNPPAD
ncbi:MAG: hypothetical protein HKN23_10010 [Verrucomicrobiales bacterium]|nr:hypothetical protein [Verrucomicrobiales bacterium]